MQFKFEVESLIIGTLCIPFFAFTLFNHLDLLDFQAFEGININLTKPSPLFYIGGSIGLLAVFGFILEIIFIINASLKARDGQAYKYPFTIKFIK